MKLFGWLSASKRAREKVLCKIEQAEAFDPPISDQWKRFVERAFQKKLGRPSGFTNNREYLGGMLAFLEETEGKRLNEWLQRNTQFRSSYDLLKSGVVMLFATLCEYDRSREAIYRAKAASLSRKARQAVRAAVMGRALA